MMKSIFVYIKEELTWRKVVALIAIGTVVGFAIAFGFKIESPSVSLPLALTYSFQIVSAAFVIAGTLIAVWQYYLTARNAKTTFQITQVQRAIDLSEYYKDNILAKFPPIRFVFENSGIEKLLCTIPKDKMDCFDTQELNMLCPEATVSKLKELLSTDEFLKSVIEANDIYALNVNFNPKIIKSDKNTRLEYDRSVVANAFIRNLIDAILNNLEYFAMHFTHNTADESVVYQSLHQSYIEIVQYLYYFIASTNKNSVEKYYTNVISLYETWISRRDEQVKDRSNKSKSIQKKGTVVSY